MDSGTVNPVYMYCVRTQFFFSSFMYNSNLDKIDDLQNYCLGTRRGIAADRGRPAVGFVYIPNGKLVHFIFLPGRFLQKIMLQKARRGKEINRGVVDQPFSHLYFLAKMKKAKGCMGEGVRSYMPLFLSRTTSYVKT